MLKAKKYLKFEFLKMGHFKNNRKNCFKLCLLIIFVIKIEVLNVWFFLITYYFEWTNVKHDHKVEDYDINKSLKICF